MCWVLAHHVALCFTRVEPPDALATFFRSTSPVPHFRGGSHLRATSNPELGPRAIELLFFLGKSRTILFGPNDAYRLLQYERRAGTTSGNCPRWEKTAIFSLFVRDLLSIRRLKKRASKVQAKRAPVIESPLRRFLPLTRFCRRRYDSPRLHEVVWAPWGRETE